MTENSASCDGVVEHCKVEELDTDLQQDSVVKRT